MAILMYLGFFAAGRELAAQALSTLTSWAIEATMPLIGLAISVPPVLGCREIHVFQKWLAVIGIIAFVGLSVAIFATSGDPAIIDPSVVGPDAGFRMGPFLLVVATNAVLVLSYGPYVAD